MQPVLVIAGREVKESLRNRWILAITGLMAALAIALAFLGGAPTGAIDASPLAVTVVGLAALSVFVVPLIALLLSYDTIVGEIDRGTMLLLLSYPVARWQVLLGKFLGHVATILIATVIGYGGAGIAIVLTGGEAATVADLRAYSLLIGTTVMLGAVFIALGYMVSAWVRERGTAAGLAVALWLVFVILFDLALLGLLVADGGQTIAADLFSALLLFNPTDVYRILNLTGSEEVRGYAGLAGMETGLTPAALGAALGLWILLPMTAAFLRFHRREI